MCKIFIRAGRWFTVLLVTTGTVVANAEPQRLSTETRQISIGLRANPGPAEQAAARVLGARLGKISGLRVNLGPVAEMPELSIYLGIAGRDPSYDALCALHGVTLPGRGTPFAEGYAAKRVLVDSNVTILALAADDRGALYAAGEIYRRARLGEGSVAFEAFDVSTAPAYRFRGFSPSQGGSMMKHTGARGWTEVEHQERLFDSILAGANTFYAGRNEDENYRQLKSLGLMTVTDARPNNYYEKFPDEWRAGKRESWEGDTWICPSIPEARAALLKQWRDDFAQRADHDIMRFYSGDPGGCKDDRCEPWGKTWVELCAEMAAIWHETHPNSKIFIANQDLDNRGDQLIFDYLQAEPRDWVYALCYSPGTNAMSPYFRNELREDLFEYPGDGWVNRYLSHTLHQLPPQQKIVHFSDITHWISAQFAVANPDVYIQKSFGRRTFHARPRAYYKIFHQIMPFSEGDIIYSEGHHDEFHQYMWARLLWNPDISLDELLKEYCTLYFGEEAAGPMAEALLQLELNLEAPLAGNKGIQRYFDLVVEGGERMGPHFMNDNYRWLLHRQKASLDCYVQLRLQRELDQESRVRRILKPALDGGDIAAALEMAHSIATEAPETERMIELREEAGRLGDQSNELFGVRDIGYSKIGQQLRDLEGLRSVLDKAVAAMPAEQRALVEEAIAVTQKEAVRGMIFW
jgi:hypothetical protein